MSTNSGWNSAARIAVVATLAFAAAATPAAARTLRKGTPYAAETTASVIGTADVHFVHDQTTNNVCEAEPSKSNLEQTYMLDWTAKYPHVTVPVADSRELGRAYRRLHVQEQPTSSGKGGLMLGDYDINGGGPPTEEGGQAAGGSDCTVKPYGQKGSFKSTGKPGFTRMDVKDFFNARRHLFFFAMPPLTADPPSYTDSLGNVVDVYGALSDAVNLVPEPANLLLAKGGWNTVPAEFSIGELKGLRRHSTVRLPANTYTGTHDCSAESNAEGSDVCSVNWTFKWTVVLHRRFLYRTKRAYRR